MSAIMQEGPNTRNPQDAGTGKRCHRCGLDLAGRVRYRDKSGYWCMPCSKADHKAYRANHLPCDECGDDVRRGTEIVVDDLRICPLCNQKRQVEAVRVRMMREAEEAMIQRRRQRLRSLRNWTIVVAELVVAGIVIMYLSKHDPAAGTVRPATSRPAVVLSMDTGKQETHASSTAVAAQTLP